MRWNFVPPVQQLNKKTHDVMYADRAANI